MLLADDFGLVLRRRKGRGWVRDRFGRRVPCSVCGEAGEVARDPMDSTGARVGSAATAVSEVRPRRTVKCDACGGEGAFGNGSRCHVCEGEGRRELHVFELRLDVDGARSGDPLTDAVQARLESGSYLELERALGRLDGFSRRVLLGEVDSGRRPLGSGAEFTLARVTAGMPEEVRVPAGVLANVRERRRWAKQLHGRRSSGAAGPAVARRDADIRGAVRRGSPVQRVAFEYGLSVSRVYQIVRGDR